MAQLGGGEGAFRVFAYSAFEEAGGGYMGTVTRLELRVMDVVRGVVVLLVVVPFGGAVDLCGSLGVIVRTASTDRDPLEVSRCLTDCGRVVTLVVSFSTDESKLI